MSRRVLKRPVAKRDLIEQADYIAKHNVETAGRVAYELQPRVVDADGEANRPTATESD